MNPAIIGQAKTALVIESQGVLTSVHVRKAPDHTKERLVFVGDTQVSPKLVAHIKETIVALIDGISHALGMEPTNYEMSVKNVSATALQNLDLSLSGYSLDLAVLLAMVSATLQLPIPESIVTTGQLATREGHFLPVAGIPEKLQAAANDSSVKQFIFPTLEVDDSAKQLSPGEVNRVTRAILAHADRLEVKAVRDIRELLEAVFEQEEICLASLRSGFFSDLEWQFVSASPRDRAAQYIGEGNDQRFWKALEGHLLKGNAAKAKAMLAVFTSDYVRRESYPPSVGLKLLQLIVSMPPFTRRKPDLFPLLGMKEWLSLAKLATDDDYPDVRLLYRAASGDATSEHLNAMPSEGVPIESGDLSKSLLAHLLAELSAEKIAKEVLLPIDTARASYIVNRVTVTNFDEFLDCITAFYAHILRHRGHLASLIDPGRVGPEALDLLRRTFASAGEERGAYSEAIDGAHGGLRSVFDEMTQRLKEEERLKHIRMVLKTAMDPLDFDGRTALIKSLMSHLGPALPAEIQNQPAERFASEYETIIEAYAQSLDKLIGTIKIL